MPSIAPSEFIVPSPQHTVAIRELPVPEIFDTILDNSQQPNRESSRHLKLMYDRLKGGVFPAFVIRRASNEQTPEQLHARRVERLEYAANLKAGKVTEFHGLSDGPPFLHYDGDKPGNWSFLHTTIRRSGKAWFARGGPDLPHVMGIAMMHQEMDLVGAIGENPTNEMLWDTVGELLEQGQTDSRLCQPDFYTTHLHEGDTVVFESDRRNDVWHRFDTDPGESFRLATGVELHSI